MIKNLRISLRYGLGIIISLGNLLFGNPPDHFFFFYTPTICKEK